MIIQKDKEPSLVDYFLPFTEPSCLCTYFALESCAPNFNECADPMTQWNDALKAITFIGFNFSLH